MNPAPHLTDQQLRLAHLLTLFLEEKITHADHKELDDWVGASDENTMTFEALTDPYFLEALHRHPELVEALGHYHRMRRHK